MVFFLPKGSNIFFFCEETEQMVLPLSPQKMALVKKQVD